ncbi:MAG: hypothetical protein ACSHXB_15275 [Sulfitobacter sp.]
MPYGLFDKFGLGLSLPIAINRDFEPVFTCSAFELFKGFGFATAPRDIVAFGTVDTVTLGRAAHCKANGV